MAAGLAVIVAAWCVVAIAVGMVAHRKRSWLIGLASALLLAAAFSQGMDVFAVPNTPPVSSRMAVWTVGALAGLILLARTLWTGWQSTRKG